MPVLNPTGFIVRCDFVGCSTEIECPSSSAVVNGSEQWGVSQEELEDHGWEVTRHGRAYCRADHSLIVRQTILLSGTPRDMGVITGRDD